MKRFLIPLLLPLVITACSVGGYSEYTVTSISDFEYNFSSFNADSLYLADSFYGGTESNSIVFNNKHDSNGNFTGGMVATMKRDSSIVLKSDNNYPYFTIFGNAAARGSSVCAVYYQNDEQGTMPDHTITFFNAKYGTCTPSYCMINNTQQTVYDALSEKSTSKFEPGDWLKLTITGYLSREYVTGLENTGSIEYYLVDWRGMKDEPDSVLSTWKTLSLSKLGDIEHLDFNIETNKENLIKTVCFDNFVSSVYLKY